jgi:hypothetical protein
MKRPALLPLSLASILMFSAAALADTEAVTITVYNKGQPATLESGLQATFNAGNTPGYAVVRRTEKLALPNKENRIVFSGIAPQIDQSSVRLASSGNTVHLIDQSYQYDTLHSHQILDKYIGKKITVERQIGDKSETTQGTLISNQGGVTLKMADGTLKNILCPTVITFADADTLITSPGLITHIATSKPGDQTAELSYETQGMTWWADYMLAYREAANGKDATASLSSWVSIVNQSGASFSNAKVEVITGTLALIADKNKNDKGSFPLLSRTLLDEASPQSKSLADYHVYSLPHPVSLSNAATAHVELLPATTNIPVEKFYVYNSLILQNWTGNGLFADRIYPWAELNKKVDTYLKLPTKIAAHGASLPAGKVRIEQVDADGRSYFIGEGMADHTPDNEKMLIKLGSPAPDITGERSQVSYSFDQNKHYALEEISLNLTNTGSQSAKVKVVEIMYRSPTWEILDSNGDFKKEDDRQVSFDITVPANGRQTVHYTVKYNM